MRKISVYRVIPFVLMVLLINCSIIEKKGNQKTCNDHFLALEKWVLNVDEESTSKYGSFPQSGYVNETGDIMIPLDEYRCLSDTFEYYGIVQDIKGDGKIYGINKKGEKIFEAVPDGEGFALEEYEGRIMIQRNGKFGFANHAGEVVIEPTFTCAENFRDGRARVSMRCRESMDEKNRWESNEWIVIDKCGNEITVN